RHRHGSVVGDAAVDQIASLDLHGWEDGRDGGARSDRVDCVAVTEHDLFAAANISGDDVQRHARVLQPVEGDVPLDEPAQCVRRTEGGRGTGGGHEDAYGFE